MAGRNPQSELAGKIKIKGPDGDRMRIIFVTPRPYVGVRLQALLLRSSTTE